MRRHPFLLCKEGETEEMIGIKRKKDASNKKICFVASSGGHWEELMCLGDIARKNNSFFVTEAGAQADAFLSENLYALPQINRHEKFFLLHFLKLFISVGKIVINEKPDVVITTGALLAFPFCFLVKLMGGKVVYIESFARVHNASMTGKLVYRFADLFIVQWESMIDVYPKAKYVGGIF